MPQKNIHTQYYIKENHGIIVVNGDQIKIPFQLTKVPSSDPEKRVELGSDLARIKKLIYGTDKPFLIRGSSNLEKTTLARAFLVKYHAEFQHLAWLEVNGNVKNAFVENTQLIQNLNLKEEISAISQHDFFIDGAFDLIINRMRILQGQHLLVLNNVGEDIEDTRILDKIRLKPYWEVLVTSSDKLEGFAEYSLEH